MKENKRKGQVWYTDFMIAVIIFVAIMLIYFYFTSYSNDYGEEITNEMMSDSKFISASLMSAGYPDGWDSTNVQKIGLTNNDNRLNFNKLEEFAQMDYDKSRNIFGSYYHYYFYIEYQTNGTWMKYNGNNFSGIYPVNEEYIIPTTRILMSDSDIVKMVIWLWR